MKKISTLLVVYIFLFTSNIMAEQLKITSKSDVLIYSNLFWTPCKEAKALLKSRGIDYNTKLITFSKKNIKEMSDKTGGATSVPQIFIDNKYFGGLLELKKYYNEL